MKVVIGIITLLVISAIMFTSCSSFGTRPSDKRKEAFKSSKNFNSEKGTFENRIPGLIEKMWKENMNLQSFLDFFKGGVDRVPSEKLPELKPNMDEFIKESDELKIIWFGHSSFLLNMSGTIVLVDPVFSKAASPVNFLVKRFQEPVIDMKELPEIDVVLISHDHYDHLDMESIKYFKDKKTKFITPLGVGSHIQGWGISNERIIEKDWWESELLGGVKFIATPAQHFSGRDGIHSNETLWASWVIQSKKHNVYFSGDSGYDIHFKEIGDKFGPFDIAFIESGQYNEKWKEVHMLPKEGLMAYKDLRAKNYFPVHWGMFELAKHSWYDPVEQLYRLSKDDDVNIVTPVIGQVVHLKEKIKFDKWWQNFMNVAKKG